ncbi:MAG: serine/threonine-protein phosphatase, partial [Bacteroidetes bacterium]|nr:serine/threonine-protein phosphatase [Bacteroidota bacterium]
VFYQPKDIVSGDFYWFNQAAQNDKKVLNVAIGDCTGHGVPGALMSILGMSSIQEIYAQDALYSPHQILDQLRKKITLNLKQTGVLGEQKDGMDLGLIHYYPEDRKLEFAGAHFPVWFVRNQSLIEIKGDRMPIGIHYGKEKTFTLQTITLEEGDWIYLFTDGFADQMGGDLNKKYLSKNFKKFLLSIAHLSTDQQKEAIEKEFQNWKDQNDQIDDVLVFGLRVN